MIIVHIGNYAWAMASLEDAQTFIKLMSKSVPVEHEYNIPGGGYREKGESDYTPDIEVTLRAGDVLSYAEAQEIIVREKAKNKTVASNSKEPPCSTT